MASQNESGSSTKTTPSLPRNIYNDPDDGRQRLLLELEFIQCLANPIYIHCFIGYLKYLQYWQRPEYIKFIMYPHSLYFLELLHNANFRNAMAHPNNKVLSIRIGTGHRQQFYFWKNYRNNRLKHLLLRLIPETSATPAPPAPTSTSNQMPLPTLPPAPTINVTVTASSTPAPSLMTYGIPPGSTIPKNEMRNSAVEKRKRK
ncbi:hypothetical protein TanjilG_32366 [Lupinus angustifolius]|uniref:Mediator of RNA polymerase II transcription subunit 31 n=1 Tax=Lupinus angustifolius TaxID=3871 RepID=A0A4P1R0I1_LUPAN|nr:hypothetical protein TanjilG_32366 [Lupinus angustifolius]